MLQTNEPPFRILIENALDTITILEQDGTIRYENPAIEMMLGYRPDEAEGHSAFEFIHTEDLPFVIDAFTRLMEQPGATETIEYRFRHKEGSWRYLESRARNLLADPNVGGIIVNSRDVTDSRRAQEALRQHQAEMEALNARLQQSMKETHHRVKNNLQIIAAMVDMQAMEATDSIPVEEFQRLSAQIRTLAVVHEVLTEEIKEEEHAQRISAVDVLSKLLPMLESMADPRPVRFEASGDARVSSRQGTSLALVANEIFLNALKHGDGLIDIRLETFDDKARLMIADQGPGIQPDFDPVQSANTGLELITSLTEIDLSGKVTFANAPRGGALVTVTFPLLDRN